MLSIDKNQIMIEHFQRVLYVSKECIKIELKDVFVSIIGDTMQVLALGKDELLIEGVFQELKFYHEL